MGPRLRWMAAMMAACLATAGAIVASSGADAPASVTLGGVHGAPTINDCMSACTYVPLNSAGDPALQVPFDGTVTSFSVNSGSAGNPVQLRVLRPSAGGGFTGTATSSTQTLAGGVNRFAVSVPVKAGDVIGLDNGNSAIIFDAADAPEATAVFNPAVANGSTATPTSTKGTEHLLLSASIRRDGSTTTTTTSTTTVTTTRTVTGPGGPGTKSAPALTRVSQSHATWRTGGRRGRGRPPVGTTFSFRLSRQARVGLSFAAQLPGRKVAGRCVAPTRSNQNGKRCTRSRGRGSISARAHAGANTLAFAGRIGRSTLSPGRYSVALRATDSSGRRSAITRLGFTIVER